jgi:hypothetical protein
MPKPSKRSQPAEDVLDPALARRLAAAMAPAALSQADRDSLHERIMQRIRDDAPPGTVTEISPQGFRIA